MSAARSPTSSTSTRCKAPTRPAVHRSSRSWKRRCASCRNWKDVTSDLQIHNPQLNVQVDRDKAYALGLTAQQISDALYSAYGQREVSTMYTPNNEYYVILELVPPYQNNPQSLSMLYVRSSSGKLVPLDTVAKLVPSVGSADGEPLGPVAGGHHQLQSEARCLAGRGDQRRGTRGATHAARHDPAKLPGNGAGLPAVVRQVWDCC